MCSVLSLILWAVCLCDWRICIICSLIALFASPLQTETGKPYVKNIFRTPHLCHVFLAGESFAACISDFKIHAGHLIFLLLYRETHNNRLMLLLSAYGFQRAPVLTIHKPAVCIRLKHKHFFGGKRCSCWSETDSIFFFAMVNNDLKTK